jgi:hypothetical protein
MTEDGPVSDAGRYLVLNAYLRNSGYHEAAWRVSPEDPAGVLDPRRYVELAAAAERGVLDSIFLPDSPGVAEFRSEYLPGAGFDPLQLLSAVAMATRQVGLIATVSTTYSHPWDVVSGQQRVPLAQPGQPGRAGLPGHRPGRAVPSRAAR